MSIIHDLAVISTVIFLLISLGCAVWFLASWIENIIATEAPSRFDEHAEPEAQPETPPYKSLYV